MDPPFYTHQLNNGIKLVMIPRNMSGLFYVSLVMRNGFIDETKRTWSYTHIGEHLLSQFTSDKYPSADHMKKHLGILGIDSNAYTRPYTTGYWLLGSKKHASFMIDVLSSAFFQFKFTDSWEKQRNIVAEELKGRIDQWTPLTEIMSKTLYPNHTLSATFKEELQSTSGATEREIINMLLSKLDPRVSTVLVEGDFDKDILLPEMLRAFDNHKAHLHYKQIIERTRPLHGPKMVRCNIQSSVISKIVYTFQLPGMSRFDTKLHAVMEMTKQYFCAGYYSRLYYLLRETHGLIYGLESEYDLSPVPSKIPGEFNITIQVDPQQVDKVLTIVNDEIERLKQNKVSRKDMLRLKNNMHFKNSMETLDARAGKFAENCAYYIVWNEPVQTYAEYFKLLQSVKAADIQDLAKRMFRIEQRLIAIGAGHHT